MKVKKLVLALAAVLCVSSFAACGDSDKKILFNEYWKLDWASSGSVDETLLYDVTFEKGFGLDSAGYTLSYSDGKYQTTLRSTAQGYEYKTQLSLKVTYQFGDETEVFDDLVETTTLFSKEALRPTYSEKTVVSHTPTTSTPGSIGACHDDFDYTIKTEYNENGTAKSTIAYKATDDVREATSTSSFSYGQGDYSYLDNEQLLLALRAIPSDTTSGEVEVYNPFLENTQRINISFSSAANREFSHTFNGEALKTKQISYRPVSLTINATNPGATQTAWIATTDKTTTKNVNRNVMLRLETPLAYNHGKLIYTLTSVTTLNN